MGLFNAAGALVQQRILEVGNASQVDLFEVPASLAAGVYFFRAIRSGSGKVLTRKLEVL